MPSSSGTERSRAMTEAMQYVTLGIERDVFGIAVESVQEILDMREVSRLPHAPASLLGLIDVRGRAVPVMDLRRKLGLPPAATTPHTRILVLEVAVGGRELVLGLVADRVFEVTGLDQDGLAPPPEIGNAWRADCLRGVGRRGDAFVIVLDLARLFAGDELALLPSSPETAAA
jgi:purine-binding chemotaxis protein CheW